MNGSTDVFATTAILNHFLDIRGREAYLGRKSANGKMKVAAEIVVQ
jgi:hypothetical protein